MKLSHEGKAKLLSTTHFRHVAGRSEHPPTQTALAGIMFSGVAVAMAQFFAAVGNCVAERTHDFEVCRVLGVPIFRSDKLGSESWRLLISDLGVAQWASDFSDGICCNPFLNLSWGLLHAGSVNALGAHALPKMTLAPRVPKRATESVARTASEKPVASSRNASLLTVNEDPAETRQGRERSVIVGAVWAELQRYGQRRRVSRKL